MLGWRLGLSAIMIPALILLFYLDARAGKSAPVLLVFCLLLGMRSAYELVLLLKPRFPESSILACGLCVVALTLAAGAPHALLAENTTTEALAWIASVFSLCVVGLLAHQAWLYQEPGRRMETLGAHLLVVSYVGVLLAVTLQLRWVAGHEAGYLVLGSLVVAAKMGDTSAYTFGRLFGKRKMAPVSESRQDLGGFCGRDRWFIPVRLGLVAFCHTDVQRGLAPARLVLVAVVWRVGRADRARRRSV